MTRRLKASDAPARASANSVQDIPAGPRFDTNMMMPGYRVRHDGWTQERTQRFLDALGHTGCVRDAARVAGVSNQAGYRLKKLYPEFSRAWDTALARAQQGLIAIAYKRAVEGSETVIIRKGEEYERRIAPSDSMLSLLVKRGDPTGSASVPPGHIVVHPDEVLTIAEHKAGWFWDFCGKRMTIAKKKRETVEEARARFRVKFNQMRVNMGLEPN